MVVQTTHHTAVKELDAIVAALVSLPVEKVVEVHDYVLFLQARYGHQVIDEQDFWSEEDLHDLGFASLTYAEKAGFVEENGDDQAR